MKATVGEGRNARFRANEARAQSARIDKDGMMYFFMTERSLPAPGGARGIDRNKWMMSCLRIFSCTPSIGKKVPPLPMI